MTTDCFFDTMNGQKDHSERRCGVWRMTVERLSLFRLAWPIFLELFLITLVGFVNVFILSKYDSVAAAAVEATNQILWNFLLVFAIISLGTSVLVAQNVGAARPETINKVVAVSLFFNTILGLAASMTLLLGGQELLMFMGIADDLLGYAHTYLLLAGGFIFFDALLSSADAVLKGFGRTKQCLAITAFMNVLNLIGSAVLGLGFAGMVPALGVQGVAIAAVVSKGVAVCSAWTYLFTNMIKVDIWRQLLSFPVTELKQLLKIGFPAAMENMSYNLSQTVLMMIIIVHLGADAYITRTYAWSVIKMAFLFSLAIGQANIIMIGQLVGAGKFVEAEKAGMKNFWIAFKAAWLIGGILFLFRYYFMEIFTMDAWIIGLGALIFTIDAFLEPGRTFNIVFIYGLRGAGDVNFPVIIAVLSMWSVTIGLGYYLGVILGLGLPAIWAVMLMDEWLRGLCMLWRWKSGAWKAKAVV
ncbi:putative membrane protein [Propionispora sp. 2/2-37]|uniref:MATE family efflux transporter n=1 Tax=Propionispora sp. 2/2-37 TaxID=1677858 RepID=UPI0006C5D826|nr:MATE family efflux transporter [Propionispora sp. 2/2-37]CUH97280.1 putative membrane protein [Propionispora sp. 2/2-37]